MSRENVTDTEGDLGAPEAVPALDLAGAGQREPGVAAEQPVKQSPVRARLRLHHAVLWEYYLVLCTVSHICNTSPICGGWHSLSLAAANTGTPRLTRVRSTICAQGDGPIASQHIASVVWKLR